MVHFLIAVVVAFTIFVVLLAVLRLRAPNGSATRSQLGGCGRTVCSCRQAKPPGEDA